MSEYTRGPWLVSFDASYNNNPPQVREAGAKRIVATIGLEYGTEEQIKADARLIAAAPELLEMVESLAILQHQLASAAAHGNKSFDTCDASMCAKARAVIAKAKGQTS